GMGLLQRLFQKIPAYISKPTSISSKYQYQTNLLLLLQNNGEAQPVTESCFPADYSPANRRGYAAVRANCHSTYAPMCFCRLHLYTGSSSCTTGKIQNWKPSLPPAIFPVRRCTLQN